GLLKEVGYTFFINMCRGMAFQEEGKGDSAFYYFRKSEPEVNKKATPEFIFLFYRNFGDYYIRKSDYAGGIDCYTKAWRMGMTVKDMEEQMVSSKELDTLYGRMG